MFVRFRQSAQRQQPSIVETRRVAGKVRHEHVASLGSIRPTPSIADVRHALRLSALDEAEFEEYLARTFEHSKRQGRLFEKRLSAAMLRRRLGLCSDKPE
jgi:hypothetical protein